MTSNLKTKKILNHAKFILIPVAAFIIIYSMSARQEKKREQEKQAAKTEAVDYYNFALYQAYWKKDYEAIVSLVNKGADIEKNVSTELGVRNRGILHLGCKSGDLKMVEIAISKGANINARDDFGLTPLHLSISYDHHEITKYLIDNGADVHSKTDPKEQNLGGYYSPFELAVSKGQGDIVKYIDNIRTGSAKSLEQLRGNFWNAITVREINYIKKSIEDLIAAGGDINGVCDFNTQATFLHIACKKHLPEVVKYLISSGADINKGNKWGQTPLLYACLNNDLEIAKTLVENGANVNAKDLDDKESILHHASKAVNFKNPNSDLVKYLIRRGADINAIDNWGRTPLHYACEYGNLEIVQCLTANGAKINAKDIDGMTPLDCAKRYSFNYKDNSIILHMINLENIAQLHNNLYALNQKTK